MEIELLETAVVLQIEGLSIVAKPYPENPDNYLPDAYPGEVLVRYTGSKPLQRDVSTVFLKRTQSIDLIFVSQVLRGDNSLYEWLDKVRKHLDGFTLPQSNDYLEFLSEDFLDEYNGTWQYGQKWQIKTIENNEQQDHYADRPLGT